MAIDYATKITKSLSLEEKTAERKNEELGAELQKLFKQHDNSRGFYKRRWRQDLAIFRSDHYSAYNSRTQRIESIPKQSKWRRRLTYNETQACVLALAARLTKTRPTFRALPKTADPLHVKAAIYSEMLLEHVWQDQRLRSYDVDALLMSLVICQSYWEVFWDSTRGREEKYLKDPETGEPATADRKATLELMASDGAIELEYGSFKIGEVGVEHLTPLSVIILDHKDPQSPKARRAFKSMGYSVDEVRKRWPQAANKDGEIVPTGTIDPQVTDPRASGHKKLVQVLAYYERPGTDKDRPNGLYAVIIDNKVVHQEDYPYDHGRLPFIKFGGTPDPLADYDMSLVSELRSLQKNLNRRISQVSEYGDVTVRPQMLAYVNQLTKKISDEPGAVIEYQMGPNGAKPEWRDVKGLPSSVFEEIKETLNWMRDVATLNEVSRGTAPPNVEAASALLVLNEQDDTRLGLRVKAHEDALRDAGNLILWTAQQYYKEQRELEVEYSDGVEQASFMNTDLMGCSAVKVEEWSTLPQSRAAERQQILELMKQGTIDQKQGLELLKLGITTTQLAKWDQHRAKQRRELSRLKLMVTGRQGGAPLPEPGEFEVHEDHLEVIKEEINSRGFEGMGQEYQQAVIEHAHKHQSMIPQPPAVSPDRAGSQLQLRAEVGADFAAQYLNQQGMQFDPSQVAEDAATTFSEREMAKAHAEATAHADKAGTDTQAAADQGVLQLAQQLAMPAPGSVNPEEVGAAEPEPQAGPMPPQGMDPAMLEHLMAQEQGPQVPPILPGANHE